MGEESNSRKAQITKGEKIMKKNKMMRIASVLLVAVLLTTSIISGTFAKYVTTGSASDNARVAKFGVVVTGSGDLFAENYYRVNQKNVPGEQPDSANNKVLTVEASENVVAPGTRSSKDDPFTISLTGTPEVDVKVAIKIDAYRDVWLQQGWFPDTTGAGPNFYNAEVYYPIVFTLKQGTKVLQKGTLAEIQAYLDAADPVYVDAGTDLSAEDYTFTLSWVWDFDGEGVGTYDKQDTLLGDIAAYREGTTCTFGQTVLTEGGQYNIDTNVTLSVTVTQVD